MIVFYYDFVIVLDELEADTIYGHTRSWRVA